MRSLIYREIVMLVGVSAMVGVAGGRSDVW
jgi:hypothetical protein